MMKKAITPLLAILAIIGALAWIYRSQTGTQKFDLNPYHALGAGVAEETAKLLGNKGSVVVISPDTSEFKNPAVEGQLKSFQDTIRKNKGMTIAATVSFKLTPMERMATGGAVPRDQFLSALQNHPNAGAVVLFCGFPPLVPLDYTALKQSGVKVIVASANLPGYRKLLESQVIQVAVVPKVDRPATTVNPPPTLRGWFEQEFQVITPANAATLAY